MKLLIIDDEEDIRDLLTFVVESEHGFLVRTASSGNKAIDLLKSEPDIFAVICDYNMPDGNGAKVFQWIQNEKLKTPFVLCSAEPPSHYKDLDAKRVFGFLEKPDIMGDLQKVLSGLQAAYASQGKAVETTAAAQSSDAQRFCPIRLTLLSKMGIADADMFLKLSPGKYIKVLLKGDVFGIEERTRFDSKGVSCLYINSDDMAQVLKRMNHELKTLLSAREINSEKKLEFLQAAHQSVQDVTSAFGFSAEAQEMTQTAVELSLSALSQDVHIFELLRKAEIQPDQYVASHSTMLTVVACGICSLMAWQSQTTFLKIALAAFLHDLPLLDPKLARVQDLTQLQSSRLGLSDEEKNLILQHPYAAAALADQMKDCPSDVGRILLQHHERPNGLGFPKELMTSAIEPLAAVFIVAHDVINYMNRPGALGFSPEDAQEFLKQQQEDYREGVFRRIHVALQEASLNALAK